MLVFCVGGHGRTGTAVASLLVTAFNYEPKEACEWVWNNYCGEALETNSQINYVYSLVGQTYTPPKTETTVTKTPNSANQTALFGINGWDND
jgi:protein-tyrosine phosphatase